VGRRRVFAVAALLGGGAVVAGGVEVRAPDLRPGDRWTVAVLGPDAAPTLPAGWERGTFWDLRPRAVTELILRTVHESTAADLGAPRHATEADRALCTSDPNSGRRLGCVLFRSDEVRASGPLVSWSDVDGQPVRVEQRVALPAGRALALGARYREVVDDGRGTVSRVEAAAIAEGLLLTPIGPRDVVLLREIVERGSARSLRYRFLSERGREVARLEGPVPAPGAPFVPARSEIVVSDASPAADDGISIAYEDLSRALVPGATGFLQRSVFSNVPLAALVPAWTTPAAMISIDQGAVPYQPDPDDPASLQVLPEVWDFTSLATGTLDARTFNTTRDDSYAGNCLEGGTACSVENNGPNPPDGTWQTYLKIDRFAPSGSFLTRDLFALNDNDTGADPSIDVTYVAQDELNSSDRTQACFDDSAGGANRFLTFFQFAGATPATAAVGVGDVWTSGAWTSCSDANGLRLTAATAGNCGNSCYPTCSPGPAPRARGMLAAGAGFRMTVVEDGWVHVPSGNYVPALLMRQDSDLLAGRDFFGNCNLAPTRQRSFDYFWVQERYGLLALVSSPNDVSPYTMSPVDWTPVGNETDGADFTWGPFPPYQTRAEACLAGTRVSWSLPADGSNLEDEPRVADYGYVVAWGSSSDPEALADWTTNPNHSPLPGEVGYLAAPPGGEPTSTVVTGWAGAAIDATVVTALRYLDPDVGDLRRYRSAAFYRVHEDPARLDAVSFRVGQEVAPFVTKSGSDLSLAWPAVAGAASYRLRVYDLQARAEIPCPAGLDCTPSGPSAIHAGGAADSNAYGYRAFAVDPCGEASSD